MKNPIGNAPDQFFIDIKRIKVAAFDGTPQKQYDPLPLGKYLSLWYSLNLNRSN